MFVPGFEKAAAIEKLSKLNLKRGKLVKQKDAKFKGLVIPWS